MKRVYFSSYFSDLCPPSIAICQGKVAYYYGWGFLLLWLFVMVRFFFFQSCWLFMFLSFFKKKIYPDHLFYYVASFYCCWLCSSHISILISPGHMTLLQMALPFLFSPSSAFHSFLCCAESRPFRLYCFYCLCFGMLSKMSLPLPVFRPYSLL